jgi:hypothetical protein
VSTDARRTVTPREIAAQRRGSTRIAPGIWIDAEGHGHISIPELLAMVDLPDTPDHRERVAELAEHVIRRVHPDATIVRQDPES